MYRYIIRYQTEQGSVADFVTTLEWHTPIQKDDVLILVYKAMSLQEEEIVPEEIREQVAWKANRVVHFPNCSLKGGPTTVIVSPTNRPFGV